MTAAKRRRLGVWRRVDRCGWMDGEWKGKDALAEGLFVSFARDESESAHAPLLKAFLRAYFMTPSKAAQNRSGHPSKQISSAS